MQLSERIQSLRKEKGLSQEELAAQLGVSRQAVGKWESGQSQPELDKLAALSEVFGVSCDRLLKGEDAPATAQKPRRLDRASLVILVTAFDFAILVLACALWNYWQTALCTAVVYIGLAVGVSGFYALCRGKEHRPLRLRFWQWNVWLVAMPLCAQLQDPFYFLPFGAPYFLIDPFALPAIGLYLVICIAVTVYCRVKRRKLLSLSS